MTRTPAALAELQAERVLDAPAAVARHARQLGGVGALARGGAGPLRLPAALGLPPIGSLASELAGRDPASAADLAAHMDRWRGHLRADVERMRAAGSLRADAEPEQLALAIFAALQGGLLLTQTMQSLEPLRTALDGALAALRSHAP